MALSEWKKFAEVAVTKMALAKSGESLLIVADTKTNQEATFACAAAGLAAGIDTYTLILPWMEPTDTRDLGKVAAGAIQGADVILGLCETMFVEKDATEKARAKGTRVAATTLAGMEEFALAGILEVDYDLMIQTAEKARGIWENSKNCRVTSALGTDISFKMEGRPVLIGDGLATEPGEADFFPGVSIANAPVESSINGIVVIDGNIPPGQLVEEPVRCFLEQGIITRIEGGRDAELLRAYFDKSGDPIARHLCHFTLGLNPCAKTTGNVHQDEHVLGAVTFGFGSQDPDFKGTVPDCSVHCDVVLTSVTITLDGTIMCENNRLNTDLGLEALGKS